MNQQLLELKMKQALQSKPNPYFLNNQKPIRDSILRTPQIYNSFPFQVAGFDFPRNGRNEFTGGWLELDRTTLGSTNTEISVSGLSNKRFLMILVYGKTSTGGNNATARMNADTGSNYSDRYSASGAADATATSKTSYLLAGNNTVGTEPSFHVYYVENLAGNEKLTIGHSAVSGASGAANAPNRTETGSKWANTSNAISGISVQMPSLLWAIGSEVVVLGWSPSDTHITNFWNELAYDDLTGGAADTLSSSFTSKKYLWVQAYLEATASYVDVTMELGNSSLDTGNNYAYRRSDDSVVDGTITSRDYIGWNTGAIITSLYVNCFIFNTASEEKLIIGRTVYQGTAGASTVVNRAELVGKWANTSNQADILGFVNIGTQDFSTDSFLRICGGD